MLTLTLVLSQYGYNAWVSAWSAIRSYGIEGESSSEHQFIQCVAYPTNSKVAWGNLIFIPEQNTALFQRAVDNYMVCQIRHTKGTQRRRTIETLPAGKHIYKFLQLLRNLGQVK